MRVHLIHGIHSSHGGNTSRLAPYFRAAGFDVMVRSYGWAFALTSGLTDWLNTRRARRLAETIKDGDCIVCHSNGAAIAHIIQEEHRTLAAVILINPALDNDAKFDNTGKVLVLSNDDDAVVAWSVLAPFSHWGSMGRDGYVGLASNVENCDAKLYPPEGLPPLSGHSALFDPANIEPWGRWLAWKLGAMIAP